MIKSPKGIFVAGTDTGVGKTYFSCQLLKQLAFAKNQTVALKPIASGCEFTVEGWRNEDAVQLAAQASIKLPYDQINPIALPEPIAPHIAAQHQQVNLSVGQLWQACQPALSVDADFYLVEGAGGWLVPLNEKETLADFAMRLNFPVVLVVGMRLGCLNHAVLTWQAMQKYNIDLLGWVANCLQTEIPALAEQIQYLQHKLAAPLLATIPFGMETCELDLKLFMS